MKQLAIPIVMATLLVLVTAQQMAHLVHAQSSDYQQGYSDGKAIGEHDQTIGINNNHCSTNFSDQYCTGWTAGYMVGQSTSAIIH